MVLYDLALEHVAPALNMWSWEQNTIPITNYLHWYVISMIFVLLFKIFKLNTLNPLAITLFLLNLLFLYFWQFF